jgi:hypothetical protein
MQLTTTFPILAAPIVSTRFDEPSEPGADDGFLFCRLDGIAFE